MNTAWLSLKNLLFTVMVPGFVAGWVPLRWFERHAAWPQVWVWANTLGAVVFALGAAIYLHCVWYFMTNGRGTPAPIDPPKKLVQRGLYRWTRNPMYLGVLALVAGEGLFLQSWHVAIYLFCLACVFHIMVALVEEPALSFRFGALYEDYKRAAPRWWPRRPRPPLLTVAPFDPGPR